MASLQAPMTRLSVETAVLGNGTNLLAFLGYVIAKVKEARSFRDECSRLANQCILLSLSFLENRTTLSKVRSGKEFIDCLQRVYTLVTQCAQKWTARHIGWELVVAGRVEALTKELESCQQSFNTEVLININSTSESTAGALASLQKDLHAVKDTLQNDVEDRKVFITHVKELEAGLQANKQEVQSLRPLKAPPLQTVPFPSPHITIDQYESGQPYSGTFDHKPVLFQKMLGISQRLPRLVQIYEKIGSIARVQQLYAVSSVETQLYALMQKVEDDRRLGSMIKSEEMCEMSFAHRLSFAYELAATVSALHGSGLLVKVISDMTISVQEGPQGQILPLLSGLGNARELWEVSTHDEHDVRYQAPETRRVGMHSKMSDVWSLGVVLQQVFSPSFPFGLSADDMHQDENNSEVIMNRLKAGINPFSNAHEGEGIATISIPILHQCLARDPLVRPTASALAQGLFDLLIASSSGSAFGDQVLEAGARSGEMLSLDNLALTVQQGKSARLKLKDGQRPKMAKIPLSTINGLLKANQDTDPTIHMLVGQAYLLDMVDVGFEGDVSYTTKSFEGHCAERALPFLRVAEKRGIEEARAELYQAHKTLSNEHKALAVMYAGLK